MSTQFDQVSVVKKANIFSDGKCVSHTVLFADGSKKTVGVMFPSTLEFTTRAAEMLELNGGKCKLRLAGESGWTEYAGGQQFHVPADTRFEIEILETLDYVCHFL